MSKRRTCGVIRSLQLAVAWLLACALVASARAEALWTPEDIALSRHVPREAEATDSPAHEADPLGLFLVVEAGGSHVTILDGEKLEPIHRFVTRGVHGSPCFTRDGRFVFFVSRDGWVTKYDLWTLTIVAEVRAGLDSSNIAISPAGDHIAVANLRPHALVLLDGELNLLKVLPTLDHKGERSSRVSAVYGLPARRSFIVAMKDIAELWEVSYDPGAEDMAIGLVHDFQYREGTFVSGYLNPRRIELDGPLDDFFFNPEQAELFGVSSQGEVEVVHLDARRRIGRLPMQGHPDMASSVAWRRDGRLLMASTGQVSPEIAVIDLQQRALVRRIALKGPGRLLTAHENSRYLMVVLTMPTDSRQVLQAIDRETLEVAREFLAEPEATLAHVEFSRDGGHVLVSLQRDEGALIVLDSHTLAEVKRLPMKQPVGQYGVWRGVGLQGGAR